jgi:hypothetical protein
MKRWLGLALAGLGVCLLLTLGHPEARRGVDSHPCIFGWDRSVGPWGELALASPTAVPANNGGPRRAPAAVSESLAADLMVMTEPEVPSLWLGTRGPPGSAEETWVDCGATDQTGSPREERCFFAQVNPCSPTRHHAQEGGFATAFS